MNSSNDLSRKMSVNTKDILLPLLSIVLVMAAIFILRPKVFSYRGFQLLYNMVIPVALATMGQMFAMAIGEIDFSLGNLVSLVTCIVCAILPRDPLLGYCMMAGIVLVYMVIGGFLYLKKLPSIIITIGMSFVWTGLGILILPSPGGKVPELVREFITMKLPYVPMPLVFLLVLAALMHTVVFKTNFGIVVRGIGGNPKAISQAGHSIFWMQVIAFGLVGLFGVLSGIALSGITTSGDANMAKNYSLVAVASVILGGGAFTGGKVSPVGAVLGACTMTLISSLLTFLRIPPDWQIGAQGSIILAVLFLNSMLKRNGKVKYV